MNFKVALLLLVVMFAVTVMTTSVMFNVYVPATLSLSEYTSFAASIDVNPMGDPVDGDLPH